ncbi:hypothetical protein DFQ28_003216 [Apophysomyces sp. BC1034]|nr:hypothetical protein DFQ30_000067 [Apophysomyces sp. BC1015]KAG0183446.1 hypothetical protein DFQ29_004390 [Apophysomyces sp. BC1021]KAG0193812.1 hypothetical protein DFQ28_003216 [Apophysomyces sp. BC1034]
MVDDEIHQALWKITNALESSQQHVQDLAADILTAVNDCKDLLLPAEHCAVPSNLKTDPVQASTEMMLKCAMLTQQYQTVVTKNRHLEHKCADLQELVKEYETNLETIASKLRSHSNASREGQLRLRKEYEALLDAEKGTTTALLMENTLLQTNLQRLAKVIRTVYEDDTDVDKDARIMQLTLENRNLRELLQISAVSQQQASTTTPNNNTPLQEEKINQTEVVEQYFTNSNGTM